MNELRNKTLIYTVGSVVYFFALWLMTVLIVKLAGFESAGLLSLAMNVTASPTIVALFNIRSYQVSDVKCQFNDSDYVLSRWFTSVLSLVICIGMILFYRYDGLKVIIILAFMVFKIMEAFGDVYIGVEQKYDRLDIAGIAMFIRGCVAILVFVTGMIITNNLLLTIVLMDVAVGLVIVFFDRRNARKLSAASETGYIKSNLTKVKSLLWICYPLAIVAFLNNLSVTVPKLVLEQYHGETILGIFNSIFSPTLVINLVATTVFAPWIPILSKQYMLGEKDKYKKSLFKMTMLTLGLTVVGMVMTIVLYKIGLLEWVFAIVFNEQIRPYTFYFIPVVGLSILMAVNACLFSICTLMRQIKVQYWIGILGIVATVLTSYTMVKPFYIWGVVWSLGITLVVQLIIQGIIIKRAL